MNSARDLAAPLLTYMTKLSPIVLFVYNRPKHTEQTLNALMQNTLAAKSTLYIYADGPKANASEAHVAKISELRELIRSKQWCKEVIIVESENNKGLATSIKTGVTEIIEKYGKVIVMEDDLITSPSFLNYMNSALDYYQKRSSVFSISAYKLPSEKMAIPVDYDYDVFVSLRNSSWGWGTWDDRWNQVDWSVSHFEKLAGSASIKEAFNRSGDDVFDMLKALKTGELDIWSIQFTLAHFVNHAVSIVPTVSYVNNIGLDGSGENCGLSNSLQNRNLNEKKDSRFTDILYEDKRIINAFYNAYCSKKRPLWQKAINRMSRILGGNNIFIIKKKIYN